MDFLKNLGIDVNESNIDIVRSKIFSVEKIANIAPREGLTAPEDFHIYDSNGRCLSSKKSVGSSYKPQQPAELLTQFEDAMYKANMDLNGIEFKEYKGGSKISFRVPMGIISFKNLQGKDDTSEAFLTLNTGFDGNTITDIGTEIWRQICTNGMMGWSKETAKRWKNTTNNYNKAKTLVDRILMAKETFTNYQDFVMAIRRKEVDQKTVTKFAEKVLEISANDLPELSTRINNQWTALNDSIDLEFSRTGATLFGLLNGATHWTNHVNRAEKTDQAEYILFGTGAKYNERANKAVLELA